MTSRERILKTLNHEEPDKVPFDLAGTIWSGISKTAYHNYLKAAGLEAEETIWSDTIQQIVFPSEKVLEHLEVDTRGVMPLTSHNWNVESRLKDCGEYFEYRDEWSFVHHLPKNGYAFTLVQSPMENIDFEQEGITENFPWPDAGNKQRLVGLRKKAIRYRNQDKIVLTKGLCAGLFEMHQRVRGMANSMIDPMLYPVNSDKLIGKLADLKIEFWDAALDELKDVVDIVGEGDDYGTQESQLISPEQFRNYYKPHFIRVIKFIKEKAPNLKLIFHSCGNVRPIIPDLIEMEVDILNPVHINASGMDPKQLKKDFGKSIVFWGGGIDTQKVLPKGTKQEIYDHVKANIDAFAPGGGFVFSTVHNVQADVSGNNFISMHEAFIHNRNY